MTYRKDLERFTICTVGELRTALSDPALLDEYELMANSVGNLAVSEWGKSSSHPDGSRYYIGYVDMANGEVHIKPGSRTGDERPGHPEQNMSSNLMDEIDIRQALGYLQRVAEAHERLVAAIEAHVAADPLRMIQEALEADERATAPQNDEDAAMAAYVESLR